eukprot:gene11889-biopygen11961
MSSISEMHRMNPKSPLCHEKNLHVGRQPGDSSTVMRKQEKLTVAYINRKNIVMIGVIRSRLPARHGSAAMKHVTSTAFTGSREFFAANGARNGTVPSCATADSNRGAPVMHWRPAPMQDMMMPRLTTVLCGHATSVTISFFSSSTSREMLSP